ncbi:hypothetical protein RV04_GL001367 [Enterococcus hermanniensis]|uniref:HTH gntR-type domain-containing protein n=2 Tax=Enterococcus hermanniensis TaxID=249189 RepID=A0A1L8TPE9_9ENTE|nr:hypothetical protein RV04_GL001367 [Enterococcus hermanniensis]
MMIYIDKNKLTVGDKLPNETELSKTLNVGRSTLREAVKILSFSNVLDVRHGSGTYIKNTTASTFSNTQLLDAREMLEVKAVDLIIKNGYQTEDMLQLKEILYERNTLLADGKFSAYVTADLQFHYKMIEMSHNPFLIRWYQEIQTDLSAYLSTQILHLESYSDNTLIHNELYHALLNLDRSTAIKNIKLNNINDLAVDA